MVGELERGEGNEEKMRYLKKMGASNKRKVYKMTLSLSCLVTFG